MNISVADIAKFSLRSVLQIILRAMKDVDIRISLVGWSQLEFYIGLKTNTMDF